MIDKLVQVTQFLFWFWHCKNVIYFIITFQNTCYNGVSGVEAILPRTEPCIMKTHLPARFLVNQINEGKLKVILVARNPKDTLVSLYHFYRMSDGLGNFSGSFDDFFELFQAKHMLLGDFFNWYASWIPYLGRTNVELFTYEGMKNDAPGTIDRVSNFLGKTTPDDKKAVILNHTTFKSMKANKMTNLSLLSPELNEKTSSFMRKGQIADWKNYFSQEQSDYVDKRYEETLKGKGYELIFE